jgi:hypothetical protein
VLSALVRASAARRLHSATQPALDFLNTGHSLLTSVPRNAQSVASARSGASPFRRKERFSPLPVGKVRSGEFASTVASDSYSFKMGMGRTAIGHDLRARRGIKMRTIFGKEGKENDRGDAAGAAAAGCRMVWRGPAAEVVSLKVCDIDASA